MEKSISNIALSSNFQELKSSEQNSESFSNINKPNLYQEYSNQNSMNQSSIVNSQQSPKFFSSFQDQPFQHTTCLNLQADSKPSKTRIKIEATTQNNIIFSSNHLFHNTNNNNVLNTNNSEYFPQNQQDLNLKNETQQKNNNQQKIQCSQSQSNNFSGYKRKMQNVKLEDTCEKQIKIEYFKKRNIPFRDAPIDWLSEFETVESVQDYFSESILQEEVQNLFHLKRQRLQFKMSAIMSGEIFKIPEDQEKIQIEQKKVQNVQKKELNYQLSKFHNKKKEFLQNVLSFFTEQNLDQIIMPIKLKNKILSVVQMVKDICQLASKKKLLDYNQCHYNVLFLEINNKNFQSLANELANINLHKIVFKYHLVNDSNCEQKQPLLQEINFIKRTIFEIANKYVKPILCPGNQNRISDNNSNGNNNKNNNNKQNNQDIYEIRAFQGLEILSQGKFIQRF